MRKFLALVLALVMTMSLVTVSAGAATDFTDDAKIVNTEAVEVLNAIGVLGGYADGSFRPDAVLTRGAGAKLLAYLMLGQEKADNLKATYTVFADVTDSVGLAPYIEWAAANGIVGGYGDGNFGPYNALTEFAFGKMLLGALQYDAEKQGYVGTGWQTRVMRDAVNKGIYDGTETYGACTRDTAARMCLATLESEYVVYGEKMLNGWLEINGVEVDIDVWNAVTVNGVYDTGLFVWETYGDLVFNGAANDKWGNIGDRWIYDGEEIGFYEDETVVTYTEQVDYCDLLVDLGVAVTASTEVDLTFVYNGDGVDARTTTHGWNDHEDEFNYYNVSDYVSLNVEHLDNHYTCDDKFVGGQGVLTKVFETGKNTYTVTEVATYLAEVTKLTKKHNVADDAELTVAYRDLAEFGMNKTGKRDLHTFAAFDADNFAEEVANNNYEKGDYVLVTVEVEDGLNIASHELVTGTSAKLAHYVTDAQASPAVGTTNKTADAFGFETGYDLVKVNDGLGEPFNFYFDAYGNVIGAVEPSVEDAYAVLDAVWSNHNDDGESIIKANVVTFDGVNNKKVAVSEFNGVEAAEIDTKADGEPAYASDDILEIAKQNVNHAYRLYKYTEDGGVYTLSYVNDEEDVLKNVTHAAGSDDLGYYDGEVLELTAVTKFLLRDMNGNYKAVTGYKELPALSAAYADVITDSEEEATIVYLHDVVYEGDKVLGYIANPAATGAIVHTDNEEYYVMNIYVDGVVREVYMDVTNLDYIVEEGAGVYEVQFNAVDGLLAVKDVEIQSAVAGATTVQFLNNDITIDYDHDITETKKISFSNGIEDEPVEGVKIYVVDQGDFTVEAADVDVLVDGENVELVIDDEGVLVAIYVLWEANEAV